MKSVLLSIQSLLAEPNPDDPLNNEAAAHWKENKKAAEAKAKEFTKKYAWDWFGLDLIQLIWLYSLKTRVFLLFFLFCSGQRVWSFLDIIFAFIWEW